MIIKSIQLDSLEVPCYELDEATSSLDIAKQLVDEGRFPEWSSVIVGRQTAGRGQMRHEWHSPSGNMYAALRLPMDGIFNSHAAAPILGGIIVENLKKNLNFPKKNKKNDFCLKWTNDILITSCNNYYKIGGILLEEKNNSLFAGIGINVNSSPQFIIKNTDTTLSASHLCEHFCMENYILHDLWSTLVYYIYLCYKESDLRLLQKCSEEISDFTFVEKDYEVQKLALERTNKYLAFTNEEIQVVDALTFEDFDYDSEGEQICTYRGKLREISLKKESLGGLVVDTNVGRRTFLNGRIRTIV